MPHLSCKCDILRLAVSWLEHFHFESCSGGNHSSLTTGLIRSTKQMLLLYLLYLDLLIHQRCQQHTVLHRLRERVGIPDLQVNCSVHHNLGRNLSRTETFESIIVLVPSPSPHLPLQGCCLWTAKGVNLLRKVPGTLSGQTEAVLWVQCHFPSEAGVF